MKKSILLLAIATIALSLCACDSSVDNISSQVSTSSAIEEDKNEIIKIAIPENYEGKTEFEGPNGAIVSINDAKEISEVYTADYGDGTGIHTVFFISYDFTWFREVTGLSFDSKDYPKLFNFENTENPLLLEFLYQKITAGETYKGYTVSEAEIVFENTVGGCVENRITFEGNTTLRGTMTRDSVVQPGSIFFSPFDKNDFLPILQPAGVLCVTWNREEKYVQVNDNNGWSYSIFHEDIDDEILTLLDEKESVDVEIFATEISLRYSDGAWSGATCKIKQINTV